jgi:hypothetical protein
LKLPQKKAWVLSYWRRSSLLRKFDEWDFRGDFPWRWCFEEIKEKRHGKIRTPNQFVRGLTAIMKFVLEQAKKDSNFRPPGSFFELMDRIRPIMEHPIVTARMKELAAARGLASVDPGQKLEG